VRSAPSAEVPTTSRPAPRLVDVSPALVEDAVVVEELATTVEAEAAVAANSDLSLVAEIAEAEELVVELDREVRGRAPTTAPTTSWCWPPVRATTRRSRSC
jgi:hypothetical protein